MLSAPTRTPATKIAAATTPSGFSCASIAIDDAAVAVARRHVERHVAGAPRHLDAPASPASAPDSSAVLHHDGAHRHAGERRGARVGADRAHLEAERREATDDPDAAPRARARSEGPSARACARRASAARARRESRPTAASPARAGSFIGPSSSIDTNSSTMKLSSSVVTTSSTPNRVLSSAGPSSSSAPAAIAAAIISGNSTTGGSDSARIADRDRGERADVELAFGADVAEPRAKGDGDGEPGEDQRRRPRQRLATPRSASRPRLRAAAGRRRRRERRPTRPGASRRRA